ncbi:citrate transporter family protein, partial [Vibrio parahaemolyticus 3256]
ASCGCINRFE